ncbi:hypothetical protein IMG5_188750 [Ichthyophthirius multifiliis]|uniref:ABC transporter domain-containing protein n=1 Tax=Ichthyophthirius multifiliis TaxID=5932 RepID=G0R408_ICHMU|nr:hypothetical protein IMG5_188750 [Ichthyophthirius multifiliis]EGR27805.1 hypothetical protein IMG5_188750 [Ichthyophthirius multifiliis]|eukprot:XP_004027150.1 hypothetical protein IMG5_188750 [Ichthyophthirius multifiliis]
MLQFKTVFYKNILISFRSRDILKETILPLFAGLLLFLTKYIPQIQPMSVLLVPIAISAISRSVLISTVEEKQERYKETQKNYFSKQKKYQKLNIQKQIKCSISFLIVPIIAGIDGVKDAHSTVIFVIGFFAYSISAVNQSFVLSTFFSNTKIASEVGTIVMIIPIFLVYLVFIESIRESKIFFVIMGLFPQCSIAFLYLSTLEYLPFSTNIFQCLQYQGIDLNGQFWELIGLIFAYLIVYLYLDQVIPNEYGVCKSPFFFITELKNLFKDKKTEQKEITQSFIEYEQFHNNQDITKNVDSSSADFHEIYRNEKNLAQTIKIKNLVKKYGQFTAIDQISISLYESNIFCLLGHNGAGKTTTISVLTGLLSSTSGKVIMYGKDLSMDLDFIRKNIGLCTQKDCLYDDLTFVEHLRFIGNIKGIQGEKLEIQIQYILEKTNTHQEANKLVKELSGGQNVNFHQAWHQQAVQKQYFWMNQHLEWIIQAEEEFGKYQKIQEMRKELQYQQLIIQMKQKFLQIELLLWQKESFQQLVQASLQKKILEKDIL